MAGAGSVPDITAGMAGLGLGPRKRALIVGCSYRCMPS